MAAQRRRRVEDDFDEYRLANRRDPGGSPALQLAGSVIVPGVPMLRRTPIVALVLFALGIAVPAAMVGAVVVNRDRIIGLALSRDFLLAAIVLLAAQVLVRFVAIAEIARAFRGAPRIGTKVALATLAVSAMGAAALWVSVHGLEARSAIANVFDDGSDEPVAALMPAPSPEETFSRQPGDVVPSEYRPTNAVTNILLLGGDAGPGRAGIRTDTMTLVSIHADSGRTAIVSIPRNLTRLRFPPGTPLAERYPDGFDDLANALFTTVAASPDLVAYYGSTGLRAEAVALAGAIGYSLGVEVDDFVLVDMIGFADVVDAVGGVTIELCQSVALPPSPPGEDPVPPEIGPGEIDMNGVIALAYARTRYADSDYERTGRQRQLMAALGSQVSVVEALRAFTTITDAVGESVRTSLTAGEFDGLLRRLGDNSAIVESVGLVPPLVVPGAPDYDEIRAIVDAVGSAIVTGTPSGYTPEDPVVVGDGSASGDGACAPNDEVR